MRRRSSNPSPIVLTTARSTSQAAQIIYGLDLRGIASQITENPAKSSDPYAVVLIKGDERIARSAIESIWDTILESTPRAMDINGNCFFCGYNTRGLLPPITCPECGHQLDSIAARRAAAENRIDGLR